MKIFECCCGFQGNAESKGYAMAQSARATVIASNIFLSTSLIFLASQAADCLTKDGGKPDSDCATTIYGFRPQSLIPNIAVISGLASAFFMPICGAFCDFTPHRRLVGWTTALMIVIIQGVQAYTVASTWFPMAILQAIAGFLYQIQVLTVMAYLPGIAKVVGSETMNNFSSKFFLVGFGSQVLFLLIVIGVSTGLGWNDVTIAHFSQGLDVVWILIMWSLAWFVHFPSVGARHGLPHGTNVWTAGFVQVYRTVRNINAHYKKGLRWYLLALVFAEAAANSFVTLAVTFLNVLLEMNGTQIGIVVLVTIISSIPGTKLAEFVTGRLCRGCPNTSWILSMICFSVVTIIGSFVLSGPHRQNLAYVFGALWGVCMGWFYPTENLFFSLALPPGQEAEMSGFYVYCSQILVWLPPLIVTVMVENGVNLKWGLMHIVIYFAIAIGFLLCVAPWPQVRAEAGNEMSVVFGLNEMTSSRAMNLPRQQQQQQDEDDTEQGTGEDLANDEEVKPDGADNEIEVEQVAYEATWKQQDNSASNQ